MEIFTKVFLEIACLRARASYYLDESGCLAPRDVGIWEYDD